MVQYQLKLTFLTIFSYAYEIKLQMKYVLHHMVMIFFTMTNQCKRKINALAVNVTSIIPLEMKSKASIEISFNVSILNVYIRVINNSSRRRISSISFLSSIKISLSWSSIYCCKALLGARAIEASCSTLKSSLGNSVS